MLSIGSLWLPIVVSAVIVFVASAIMHMVLKYHSSDFAKLPGEDEAMAALGRLNIPPGTYMMPHGGSMEAMKDPVFIEKMTRGPVAIVTVLPSGPPAMGKNLMQWFGYCLIVGVFAAYLAGHVLSVGAPYLEVFRITGTVAFAGYSLALMQNSIWLGRSWGTTLKSMMDGLVYALLTGGTFGWLWPI